MSLASAIGHIFNKENCRQLWKSGTHMATVDLVFSAEKCEDLLKQAKEKVKLLRDWKDRAEGGTANFEEELGETLQYCSEVFETLRFHRQLF